MKKVFCFLFVFAVLFVACDRKNDKYANLPKPLAELCVQIDKHPNDAELYYNRAQYYLENGFMEKGFEDAKKSIELDASVSKYHVLLSDFYFSQRETDLAEESLQRAITLDEKNNEARLKLAELYFHLNMVEQCTSTLDKAIELQSYNPKAYLTKAFCYKELQDTANMIRFLHLVIDQDPKEKKAHLELGYFYQQQKNPIAIEYYKAALNQYPTDKEIIHNLAVMYMDLGEIELAKEQYNYLLSVDPENIGAFTQLGYISLYYEDNYDESIRYLTQAITLDSTFVEAVCNRGLAFELKGEVANARQDYGYCLKVQPNFEPAVKGMNRLDKMGR